MDAIVTKLPLWTHQQKAYQFADKKEGTFFNCHMGTGKSAIVVALATNKNIQTVLISCPLKVIPVWRKQFELHSAKSFSILLLDNTYPIPMRKEKAEAFLDIHRPQQTLAVIVVNHDAIWRDPLGVWILKQHFDFTICDESHFAKSNHSKLSLFMMRLGYNSRRKAALTGTPMPQDFTDIFAQCRFINPRLFGYKFAPFREYYAKMGGFKNKKVIGFKTPEREQEFNQKLATVMFTVKKQDTDMTLPEELHVVRTCRLSEKSQEIYNSLSKRFFAEIADGTCTAVNAGVKILRLQQVTSGHIRLDDTEKPQQIGTEKEELLTEILECLAEPVVVFCRFTADLTVVRRVTEKLKRKYGELSGTDNDLTADATMPTYCDVLGVQIQAGGVGIDLTQAATVIDFSLTFNLAEYLQSRARVHRPGQTRKVTYIHLVAEKTIDEYISLCLQRKENAIEKIIENVRNEQHKGVAA